MYLTFFPHIFIKVLKEEDQGSYHQETWIPLGWTQIAVRNFYRVVRKGTRAPSKANYQSLDQLFTRHVPCNPELILCCRTTRVQTKNSKTKVLLEDNKSPTDTIT